MRAMILLLAIISGIIALATLEAGQGEFTKETDINQILLNVRTVQCRSDFCRPISYDSALSDDLAIVYRSVKAREVLVNLVGNALKFTIKGKSKIWLYC
jgi:signal transduction histidine kinase